MALQPQREERLKALVGLLPHEPGVYRFLNKDGKVIYVGKAKDLKKRVASYFRLQADANRKLRVLVSNIDDIRHIVVPTEGDALLLENNLIKELQPRYNILLKDDKTYPWIRVSNEPYPRVFSTRQVVKDGSRYYGPYASVVYQRSLLDLVRKLYQARTCALKLTPEGVVAGRFDRCLEAHIGNCKAPCVNEQSQQEYQDSITMVEHLLKGNLREAEEYLALKMRESAQTLRFEDAQHYKERLLLLENYQSKTVIVSPNYTNLDIFSLVVDGDTAYCNFMRVMRGAVVNSLTVELKPQLDESEQDILTFAISQLTDRLEIKLCREVLVSTLPDTEVFPTHTFSIPQRGDKLKLLSLSLRNCKGFRLERLKQLEKLNPERHTERLMDTMRRDLHLDNEPRHIECFDNSNIQGTNAVAACVVFRDGRPAKRDYRHFNIKTVVGIDDFASMQEVVYRRYKRLSEEQAPLPDLIVVDGGKGQLSSAYEVLKTLGLEHKIAIIGLAKRLEEVFYPNDSIPLYLDKSSQTLKVLMHIRDEAHRFGITFHRDKRSKAFIKTELEQIPNLGEVSIGKLLKRFKTISKIKAATAEQLAQEIGAARATAVRSYFEETSTAVPRTDATPTDTTSTGIIPTETTRSGVIPTETSRADVIPAETTRSGAIPAETPTHNTTAFDTPPIATSPANAPSLKSSLDSFATSFDTSEATFDALAAPSDPAATPQTAAHLENETK